MVEVLYDGNLGNNLFQYCFGRIIAETLGYELKVPPIHGFPGTAEPVRGKNYEGRAQHVLRGQKVDLNFLTSNDPCCHFLLTGYFQRFEYYKGHRPEIQRWLKVDKPIAERVASENVESKDLVVGIRRGKDYVPRHGLPLSYYKTAIESFEYRNLHICSDDPSDPFVRHLAKKYRGIIRAPNALDNLSFIGAFDNIIISNSSFLWWAAYLSDAQRIVAPRPSNGFWSHSDPLSKHIDLELPDPRYRYFAAEVYRAEFVAEAIRSTVDRIVAVVRAGARSTLPSFLRSPRPRPSMFAEP
jgi:hypothetical protein